jgi:hypothetical protein
MAELSTDAETRKRKYAASIIYQKDSDERENNKTGSSLNVASGLISNMDKLTKLSGNLYYYYKIHNTYLHKNNYHSCWSQMYYTCYCKICVRTHLARVLHVMLSRDWDTFSSTKEGRADELRLAVRGSCCHIILRVS